jgi:hypothetical protein
MTSHGLVIPSPLNQGCPRLCGYINQVTYIFSKFIIPIGLQITPKIATSDLIAVRGT